MKRYINKIVLCAMAGTMVFAYSCKKSDSNSPSNNGNNNNTNPFAPKITIQLPKQDTMVGIDPAAIKIKMHVASSGSVRIDSIVGSDGMSYKRTIMAHSLDTTIYDYYTVATGYIGTVTLTYKVYDAHGDSASAKRNITVKKIPVFQLYSKVFLADQTYGGQQSFINTGNNPVPKYYAQGDVDNDTSLRRLVDMGCAYTKGGDIIFSPGFVNNAPGAPGQSFSDSDIFSINSGWTKNQRKTTLFRLLGPQPKYAVSSANYPNYATVEATYKAATTTPMARVEYGFTNGNNYAFLTSDGRYGIFTVTGIGRGVQMDMAIESK